MGATAPWPQGDMDCPMKLRMAGLLLGAPGRQGASREFYQLIGARSKARDMNVLALARPEAVPATVGAAHIDQEDLDPSLETAGAVPR